MHLSISQAAAELGVASRQVGRSVASGRVAAATYGASHALSKRQVQALECTAHRGRNWTDLTQEVECNLLATGNASELSNSERSQMKSRVSSCEVGAIAAQILPGRVSLRKSASEGSKQQCRSSLLGELGLSERGGLGVLVAHDANRAARRARLGLEDSGDIAVVEGNETHRSVVRALRRISENLDYVGPAPRVTCIRSRGVDRVVKHLE
jgi:hypothetical protein